MQFAIYPIFHVSFLSVHSHGGRSSAWQKGPLKIHIWTPAIHVFLAKKTHFIA
jgi:hypothetical protein